MASSNRVSRASTQGFMGPVWNLIGGSFVCAMVAGVVYFLFAMIASQFYASDGFWDTKYLLRIFVVLLVFYLVAPVLFAKTLTFLFGSNKKIQR